jgi:hypothetical protein
MTKCVICNVYEAKEGATYCPKCIGVFGLIPAIHAALAQRQGDTKPTYEDLRAELHTVECVLAQLETLTDGFVRRIVTDELARVDALLAHCQ